MYFIMCRSFDSRQLITHWDNSPHMTPVLHDSSFMHIRSFLSHACKRYKHWFCFVFMTLTYFISTFSCANTWTQKCGMWAVGRSVGQSEALDWMLMFMTHHTHLKPLSSTGVKNVIKINECSLFAISNNNRGPSTFWLYPLELKGWMKNKNHSELYSS